MDKINFKKELLRLQKDYNRAELYELYYSYDGRTRLNCVIEDYKEFASIYLANTFRSPGMIFVIDDIKRYLKRPFPFLQGSGIEAGKLIISFANAALSVLYERMD